MKMKSDPARLQIVSRIFGATMMLLMAMSLALMGCAKKEKVLEVTTPGGSVEVEKTTHPDGDGGVEIEVNKEK